MANPSDIRDYLEAHASPLLRRASGSDAEVAFAAVDGGRNNRVFRAEVADAVYCVKWYFVGAPGGWDRLRAETDFSRWCAECGANAPRLVDSAEDCHLAIFDWVEGAKPLAEAVDAGLVSQLVEFLHGLNPGDRSSARLSDAAEACFSFGAHFEAVETRLRRFESLAADDDLSKAAKELVVGTVLPLLAGCRSRVERWAATSRLDWEEPLDSGARWISPSDFGFHNAILSNGRLVFCDFEYAGWDDPAKTICDALCQVEAPIPDAEREPFVDAASQIAAGPDATRDRARALLPLYEIKWCGILLNEFHAAGRERREFTRSAADSREAQLEKAEQMARRAVERLEP